MKPFLFALALVISVPTQAKEIAFTFDDAPRAANGYLSGPERAQMLIEELSAHDIPQVAFFSNSNGLLNPEGKKRLQAYDLAGHIIANHTHSHPDFNTSSLREFEREFLRADSQLRQFKGFKKLFRFPYLREGDTAEKRDGMREILNKHGYINAYITLNNYDWHIEALFQGAIERGVTIDLRRLRDFYVAVMLESIEYYAQMAVTHLGRSPKHVLLLHELDISALFVGDLADELRRRGWQIIPPEDAYTDELSEFLFPQPLYYNPGRIGEVAHSKGQTKGLWHETLDEDYLKRRFDQEVIKLEP